MGTKGRIHTLQNYNFEQFGDKWVNLMTNIYETNGSWENRKNYKHYRFEVL